MVEPTNSTTNNNNNNTNKKQYKVKQPKPLISTYITSFILSSLTYIILSYATHTTKTQILLLTLLAAYLPSYLDGSENNPSHNRYWPALVRWSGWHYILSYFSPKLVIDYNETIELLKFGQQHILLSHPHGVNSYNHFILMTDICKFATKYNNSIHQRRELVATILFKLPLLRELVLWLGCIDASKSVVDRALQQGYSIQLYSGGEREQLHSNSIQPIIVAKKRKGIIRLALKYNIPLIPLFTFNEDQCFDTYHTLLPFQLWLSHKLRVALPFATGRYMLPYVPYKVQLVTVVGKPIKLNKTIVDGNYTDDDVNELSDLYIQGMIELFDKYKDQYSQYKINEIKVI